MPFEFREVVYAKHDKRCFTFCLRRICYCNFPEMELNSFKVSALIQKAVSNRTMIGLLDVERDTMPGLCVRSLLCTAC